MELNSTSPERLKNLAPKGFKRATLDLNEVKVI